MGIIVLKDSIFNYPNNEDLMNESMKVDDTQRSQLISAKPTETIL